MEDEPEHEPEVPAPAEPVVKKPAPSIVPKDAERQLSKKELKKKELAELDAVLAELGISGKDNNSETDGTNGNKVINFDVHLCFYFQLFLSLAGILMMFLLS